MHAAAYLNDIPRPFWIAAMVVAFIWHWPIGLALLAYLIGSGRLGRRCGPGRWYNMGDQQQGPTNMNGTSNGPMGWGKWGSWAGCAPRGPQQAPSSGNHAFDEYRAETLRRLEDEQKEFVDYLDRLRQAKDRAEFDQFMADRRRPPEAGPAA